MFDVAFERCTPEGLHHGRLCHPAARPHYADLPVDRIFLQAYVPKHQSVGQVCLFLNRQRGFRIPSSAAFGQNGEAYMAAIHRWAEAEGIPIRYFAKGENKEAIAEPLLRAAADEGGAGKVVLIGMAQETASA